MYCPFSVKVTTKTVLLLPKQGFLYGKVCVSILAKLVAQILPRETLRSMDANQINLDIMWRALKVNLILKGIVLKQKYFTVNLHMKSH